MFQVLQLFNFHNQFLNFLAHIIKHIIILKIYVYYPTVHYFLAFIKTSFVFSIYIEHVRIWQKVTDLLHSFVSEQGGIYSGSETQATPNPVVWIKCSNIMSSKPILVYRPTSSLCTAEWDWGNYLASVHLPSRLLKINNSCICVCTEYILFTILPLTKTTVESSFCKLRLIKMLSKEHDARDRSPDSQFCELKSRQLGK